MIRAKTTEEFIKEAIEVHGNRYDYSKVEYVKGKIKVCIVCPIHGPFWQQPSMHIFGQGCRLCAFIKRAKDNTWTKEEFIKKAIEVHGEGKYDYSKVEYIKADRKVKILCLLHDDFFQTPMSHMAGKGCPDCGLILLSKINTMTKEDFIIKAIKKHGKGTYDYSKVDYLDAETKVCIICPTHGKFMQTPHSHLRGRMCIKCGYIKTGEAQTLSLEDFISKAKEAHGDLYDYSDAVYVDSRTKISIKCKIHGLYRQNPMDHLSNTCGCPKCGWEQISEKMSLTQEEFIKRAIELYGEGKYDYSRVLYNGATNKVEIGCPRHNFFWQWPFIFLRGYGCTLCAREKKISEYDCVSRFIKVHGNLYDYSEVKYVKSNEKVIIICKVHGKFLKSPRAHIEGQICPVCSGSYGELAMRKWFDENNIEYIPQYKYSNLRGSKNKPLRFDFYIPILNLLLEFDGEQHFRPVCFNGMSKEKAMNNFNKVQRLDGLKNEYCKIYNIPILRVSYKDFKKIPEILSENILRHILAKAA